MSLSIGIVGLPNVGKSTLFNALTQKSVPAENYPFCTIDPSVGVVAVPDERLWKLSEFSKSKKTVPSAVEFVDIAGIVKGASTGEGLGNKFLSNIREVDAIAEVVRIFEDDKVIHVDGKVDPLKDIEIINLELILADSETVSKRKSNIARDVKRGDKTAILEDALLLKIENCLKQEKLASEANILKEEREMVKSLHLLTMKPFLYVLNKKSGLNQSQGLVGQTASGAVLGNLDEIKDARWEKLMNFMRETKSNYVIVDAGIEQELKDLDPNDKQTFRTELTGSASSEDGVNDLIKSGYKLLNLITYFTTGEDETRGWTILRDSTAPIAGQAIHTDFKEKFIKAEVIEWDKLLESGSYANARERGLVRTEGKEYIVKDGDVIEFKI